tara:strand:- start:487 stop:1308 length:822 start_codon:yes stop_codon:yes gene_type:complete
MTEETQAPAESTGQASAEEVTAMQFQASSLPEGLRNEPSLQTFDTVDKLAKSYVNAVKKIGADPDHMVKIPQDGESWDNFYNQIGRPENPENYDFGDDEGALDEFRDFAHKTGLTQNQANNILELYGDIQERQNEQVQQAREDSKMKSQVDLQKEWGKNYTSKIDLAQRAVAQLSTPEFTELLNETGLGNHKEVIRVFAKVGEILGEDSLVVGTGLGSDSLTPQQAQEEIKALYADKDFSKSYRDNRDPGHKSAMNKMGRLFQQAYPGPSRIR